MAGKGIEDGQVRNDIIGLTIPVPGENGSLRIGTFFHETTYEPVAPLTPETFEQRWGEFQNDLAMAKAKVPTAHVIDAPTASYLAQHFGRDVLDKALAEQLFSLV